MSVALLTVAAFVLAYLLYQIVDSLFLSPLARSRIPGPKLFALTGLRLAYEDYKGDRSRTFLKLHQKYGPVVRVGPNEVIFNSTSALRSIYGAGSGFERTDFYRPFDVYGRRNMFSFSSSKDHGDRKRLLAHAYSKSSLLKGENAALVEKKVRECMGFLDRERESGNVIEVFSMLHFFAIDAITEFLYGSFGRTTCLEGSDRDLISDIVDKARRRLTWFSIHLPGFTSWLYSRKGIAGRIASCFYPMKPPTTYTGIRLHARKAVDDFSHASEAEKSHESALVSKVWKSRYDRKKGPGLDELDIASELADHLLAGIDTTSDSTMFLIWCLSLPGNEKYQQKLIDEVQKIPNDQLNADSIPRVEVADTLPYTDAVIKETLRLFAPLPGSEPRSLPTASTIDGYVIPPRTVVSMSPYTLHRNPEVFENPSEFNPDRWLDETGDTTEMRKWFWAFSSGARMCIGLQYGISSFPPPPASSSSSFFFFFFFFFFKC